MYIEDENISSSANFTQLRRECFRAVNRDFTLGANFPNIAQLAREYEETLQTMKLEDVARVYKDNKISLIKEIRRRYPDLGLLEAKCFSDGLLNFVDPK